MEFGSAPWIDARLRGSAKAVDIWRLETKLEASPVAMASSTFLRTAEEGEEHGRISHIGDVGPQQLRQHGKWFFYVLLSRSSATNSNSGSHGFASLWAQVLTSSAL